MMSLKRKLAGALFLVHCLVIWAGFSSTTYAAVHDIEVGNGFFVWQGHRYPLDGTHLLLDGTLPPGQAHPFVYRTFQEINNHLSDGTEADPMTVYIAPYVYWIDDPDDERVAAPVEGRGPFGMTVRCQYLHLIGLTSRPEEVVLASQRGQTQGADGNFTMFDFWGDGLEVSNLTMGNYCNVDLDYPLHPQLSRKKRSSAITQAHVAYCHGDKAVARNVRFISRLNMNPLNGARRILFDRCHMECTDDALTGNGVYLHCDFDFYGQKPFYTTHPSGAVFIDCDFRLLGGSPESYFCKADGPLTLIDCRIQAPEGASLEWTPYPHRWTRCYQKGVTLNGRPYVVGEKHPENTVQLEGKGLLRLFCDGDAYRTAPLLTGDDGWNPGGDVALPAEQCAASLRLTPCSDTLVTGGASVVLAPSFTLHGGYPVSPRDVLLTWQVEEPYREVVRLRPLSDGNCEVVSLYDGDQPASCLVWATTADGLCGAAELTLKGRPLPPPVLRSPASIIVDGGVARVVYDADLQGKTDDSWVDWYRCPSSDPRGAVLVSSGRELRSHSYTLSQSDAGHWLMAVLTLKNVRSAAAAPDTLVYPDRIKKNGLPRQKTLHTDFADFPCRWQPEVKPGFWTVDGYKPADTAPYEWSVDRRKPMWVYGEGYNGAVGRGLMQAQKGARLRYTPSVAHKGDMRLVLRVDPAKTAGQGFGSATAQYMDVCLKFDTRTLTGYGLRIIRTVKYANAVDFFLVAYDGGEVRALTAPVSALCYRTGCVIDLQMAGNILTADVTTTSPMPSSNDTALQREVHLSAEVAENKFGGIHIQHTGSCGESVTMLHELTAIWE